MTWPTTWPANGLTVAIGGGALAVAAGFWLWRRRRLLRAGLSGVLRPTAEAPSEWTAWLPPDRFIVVGGLRVRVAQAGRGPALVLLHGIGASMHAWRFIFRPLSERYSVTALDLPGFGSSAAPHDRDFGLDAQADRAEAILTELGIDRCGLVGSSMGGAIALWMSKRNPNRFPKVAALAPAVDDRLAPRGLRWLQAANPAFARALGPKVMRLILRRVVARADLIDQTSVEAYLRPFRESHEPLSSFWGAMKLLSDPRLPAGLAQPKARVLVLHGARDLLVSRASIARYLKVAPKAELMEHPHGGHHIMEDEPKWTAAALNGFFGRF